MTGSLYSKTRPRIELYCRNIDGEIVIVHQEPKMSELYHPTELKLKQESNHEL